VNALGRTLRESVEHLQYLDKHADDLYRGPIPQEKKDGGVRYTYDAFMPLKRVHDKIQTELLQQVQFPAYLMGGLEDPEGSRGYIRNAQNHAGAQLLVGEDVEDFFPSVKIERVRSIFQYVFHFPEPVSTLLAKICTRRGALVQGAIVSTYLANLALYREEPELYRKFAAMGVLYTRFVDDMHASSRRRLDVKTRTMLVRMMRSTLERAGLRPKRKKQFVVGAGSAMKVHRLNVVNVASKDIAYRGKLRAVVHNLESMASRNDFSDKFEALFRSAVSRASGIALLNPGDTHRFKLKLSLLAVRLREHRRVVKPHATLGP
jgi:hypothetical protein